MTEFFDALETRTPEERERALMLCLRQQVEHARSHAPAFSELLRAVDPTQVVSKRALASLPVIRKHADFLERHKAGMREGEPFGGYASVGWRECHTTRGAKRVFQSPGPIYEPEGFTGDFDRLARAMFAAGFRRGDLVHNSFSYHLTPAGAMMEAGAIALGCTVFPGGVGNTDLQLQAIGDLRPACYVGTPGFLKVLLDRAEDLNVGPLSFRQALVSGEAFPNSLRAWFLGRGVDAYQAYATADLGLIAYETSAKEGLVVDEGVILEIVRPGSADPVPDGEVGEVVITSLNRDYPLIRFGTGDLSAVLQGSCPTGRTNVRIKGWLGRADQAVKVRGMFVHPSHVAEIIRRHPQILRARLVIAATPEQQSDDMVLRAEVHETDQALAQHIASSMRSIMRLRGSVELLHPGGLPNDGKVIDDQRPQPGK